MAVASLDAADRFQVNAAALSSLAVLQLATYATMQVPVGVLLDRFGPRRMLAAGGLIMAVGQLTVALSIDLTPAVIGRVLVGAGDAFTFISMIRMVNNWVTGRSASVIQQWLSTIGQLGQIVSAFPFVALLELSGWQSGFVTLAVLSLIGAGLTMLLAVDHAVHKSAQRPSLLTVVSKLRKNIKHPPVRMAFWTHFSTQSMGNIFALLWGVPFMVGAEGLSRQMASVILTVFVITNASMGPIIGALCLKRPDWQSRVVVGVPIVGILAWLVVLGLPSPVPVWLLMMLAVALGIGGPTSMLAFDYTRTYVKQSELGAANGFVNIGGFLAGFIMMALIGFGLDLANAGGTLQTLYSAKNFRAVLWVQFLVVGVGLWGFLREQRLTKQIA